MNKFSDQLFVKLTDEPCFVIKQFRHFTLVRRPVMSQNGICYKLGLFFNAELETLQEQTQRTLAIIKSRNELSQAEMEGFGPDVPMPALSFKKNN